VNLTVKVYPSANSKICSFVIHREVFVKLCTGIHVEMPRRYSGFQKFRDGPEGRYCWSRILIQHEKAWHLFRLWFDDTTAQGFLILVDIWHSTYEY